MSALLFPPDTRSDDEILQGIAERYAEQQLRTCDSAGYWVRCVLDHGEAGVIEAMCLTLAIWQRQRRWNRNLDLRQVATRALDRLLEEPLDRPISRIRRTCWPLIEDCLHRSDPGAVERSARSAAPGLPEGWLVATLAEIVRQQRGRHQRAARARR